MLKRLLLNAAIVLTFINISHASCDCRWKVTLVNGLLGDMDDMEVPVHSFGTLMHASLMCSKQIASSCSGVMATTPIKALGDKNITDGCSLKLRLFGQIDRSGQPVANGSSIELSGTPKGCPVVKRTLDVTVTNPKNFTNSVMLFNGQVWPADGVEKRISIKTDEPKTFTFAPYNPQSIKGNIIISKISVVSRDSFTLETSFNETNQPTWSDIPQHLHIMKQSESISVIYNPTSERFTTLGFIMHDGISAAPTSYSIRFTNDFDRSTSKNEGITTIAVTLSYTLLSALFSLLQ